MDDGACYCNGTDIMIEDSHPLNYYTYYPDPVNFGHKVYSFILKEYYRHEKIYVR